ncbi:hypothetical protein BCON_0029g00450 [Botryotinia convoluta]|uniref:Uncharacterized protein n=1 Tax=Botryotinia convoluta TaxID=54673 RepID=A0A4Z1IP37_9HELO|nr:hypothetical protein BCON_0029g00450 [Botryotinia convoluta]
MLLQEGQTDGRERLVGEREEDGEEEGRTEKHFDGLGLISDFRSAMNFFSRSLAYIKITHHYTAHLIAPPITILPAKAPSDPNLKTPPIGPTLTAE